MHDKLRYAPPPSYASPRYRDICRLLVAWLNGHVTDDECRSYGLWLMTARRDDDR